MTELPTIPPPCVCVEYNPACRRAGRPMSRIMWMICSGQVRTRPGLSESFRRTWDEEAQNPPTDTAVQEASKRRTARKAARRRVPDCVHLGGVLKGQAGKACMTRLRACAEFGECTIAPCPDTEHHCLTAFGSVACPAYASKEEPRPGE